MGKARIASLFTGTALAGASSFPQWAAAEDAAAPAGPSHGPAPDTGAPSSDVAGAAPSFLERETLSGDWFGAGEPMREHGVNLTGSLTQFYAGPFGEGQGGWKYGGKLDGFLRLDASRLGLWTGLGISAHAELNYGQCNRDAGGLLLLPSNSALTFPGCGGALGDLALSVSQQLGPVTLVFGKLDMVDFYADHRDFSGGRGIEQFQHLEFVAPFTGITPPMIFGGLVSLEVDPATFTLLIYDPGDQTQRTGLEDAFEEGVTFNGSVEFSTNLFHLPGRDVLTAAYSTKAGVDLRDIPELAVPGAALGQQGQRWYLAYNFEQAFWQDAADLRRTWGVFGQVALADGNPNPARWTALLGVGGTSPLSGRGRDRFGLGLFYVGVSAELKASAELLEPPVLLGDEYGAEIFYNLALLPWLRLTADLQLIGAALGSDAVVVGGVRAQVVF